MKIHIETNRLILREIEESDVQGMYEMDRDPDVHRFLGNNPVKSEEETAQIIQNIKNQYQEFGIGRWAIIDKSNRDFIGWSGLKYEQNEVNGHVNYYDLGYRLKKKYWGLGIATETALPCIKYGFETLGLSKINAAAHVDNIGSNIILKKIGMEFKESFVYKDLRCHWYEIKNTKKGHTKV